MTNQELIKSYSEILANQLSQNLGAKLTEALATGLLQVSEARLAELLKNTEEAQ